MTHGIALVRRVLAERRGLVTVLLVATVLNILAYGFAVYPLSRRVANVAQREREAERALDAARAEHEQATGTLTGTSRAGAELATFYTKVLPQDLAGARRLTYLRLARLARDSNLDYRRATYSPVVQTRSALTRLQIQLVLSGTYGDMRDFIYQLETSPEFVVIDNVQLAEGADGAGSLVVTLDLSTYFRNAAP